ncbi:MAG: SDR family NAD(P)-dependent oxidoreductase [Ruminococcaceae bacterium]|nr:SDR family NAD(P)-dependent oxidoreductase [Oscillospiraceae bacterium]MBO4972881.1 SDR family oxidoreductase [Clostridia bacterium]
MKEKTKVAVVTGGGGVLCSAFAKCLAKEGYSVAVLDLNLDMAKKCADEIVALGGVAKAYKANVLDKAMLESVREEINADLGKCTLLINGAGGNNPKATAYAEYYNDGDESREDVKTFFNIDRSDFGFVFDLNIVGTLIPSQVFSPEMIGNPDASIINISSMNAFTPLTKIPAYSAAKSAVSNFTQWLAVYFAKTGLRVNAIAPGFFVTNQNRALLYNDDGTPTPRTDKILNATPMGRFGDPDELLGALKFLADSSMSSFVTGVVIPIDGGFSAYSGV